MTRLRLADRDGDGARPRDLGAILARKRELVARCAEQRFELAQHVAGLAPAFAVGDRVVGVGRYLRSHPFLLAAAGVLLLARWPRAVLGLATRGFVLWKGAGAARRLLGP